MKKAAKDLTKFVTNVNPDESIEQAFKHFYVERGEISPVNDIIDHIMSENTFAKILFTGPRGCGKETELIKLSKDKDIKRYFHVKLISGPDDLTKLINKIIEKIVEIADEEKVDITDLKTEIEIIKKYKEGWSTEAEFTGTTKNGIPDIFNFGDFKSEEKNIKVVKKKAGDVGKPPEYDKYIEKMTGRIFWEGYHRKKDVLLLVANLDKIGLEKINTLFSNDLLTKINCYIVYTFPFEAIRDDSFPAILRKFSDEVYFLPNLQPYNKDGSRNLVDYKILHQILANRIHRSNFRGPEIIDDLIRFTGGNPHELLRLSRECARRSLRRASRLSLFRPKISRENLREILEWRRRLYLNTFDEPQLKVFKSVYESGDFLDKKDSEFISLLNQNLIFQYGPYHDIWDKVSYQLNPIILDTFPEKFLPIDESQQEE